jgi:hypothetical protein
MPVAGRGVEAGLGALSKRSDGSLSLSLCKQNHLNRWITAALEIWVGKGVVRSLVVVVLCVFIGRAGSVTTAGLLPGN